MFRNLRKRLMRGNHASPYYGTNEALFGPGTDIPMRQDTGTNDEGNALKASGQIADNEWERRRFELVKMLVAQERRSVVLGKLQANNRQIAENARRLADATIAELVNHPYREDYDTGKQKDG